MIAVIIITLLGSGLAAPAYQREIICPRAKCPNITKLFKDLGWVSNDLLTKLSARNIIDSHA